MLRFLIVVQDGLWEMLDSSGSTSLPLMTHAMSTAQLFAEVEDVFPVVFVEVVSDGQAIPARSNIIV